MSLARFLLLGLLAANVTKAQSHLPTETAQFTVNQGNHPVGQTGYSIQSTAQGVYLITTHGRVNLSKTKYSFSGEGRLTPSLAIQSESLNGTVNGAAVTFNLQNTGRAFSIHISANGKNYSNTLTPTSQTVFLPDFDLAAYPVLLTLATQHPGVSISALIPKQTGILSTATLSPQSDAQATWNGKQITVRHSSLTVGAVTSELYYSSENRILEVDIPGQTFAILRDGFQLSQPPPPPPEAAPAQTTPQN